MCSCKEGGSRIRTLPSPHTMDASAAFQDYDPEEVGKYLKQQIPALSGDILEKIVGQKIDGEVFLALDEGSLREIAPLLGDRVKIKRAQAVALSEATFIPGKVFSPTVSLFQ